MIQETIYSDNHGNIVARKYSNGLSVYYKNDTEYWHYKLQLIPDVHSKEEAFKALEMKSFW